MDDARRPFALETACYIANKMRAMFVPGSPGYVELGSECADAVTIAKEDDTLGKYKPGDKCRADSAYVSHYFRRGYNPTWPQNNDFLCSKPGPCVKCDTGYFKVVNGCTLKIVCSGGGSGCSGAVIDYDATYCKGLKGSTRQTLTGGCVEPYLELPEE